MLYCRTFFACSLNDDVVCKNEEINDKHIVDTNDVED